MDRIRFNRGSSTRGTKSSGTMTLQKQIVLDHNNRRTKTENVPDLTDFMNDMFFGTVDVKDVKKEYNLTGRGERRSMMEEEMDFDDSTRSNSSRMTQEWLEEAKRMVASSPNRSESPAKYMGSPCRFGARQAARLSPSLIDRRDPLSRSARRHRSLEGFSEEIISKTSKHSRNKSAPIDLPTSPSSTDQESPTAAVHRWFSNILKPSNAAPPAVNQISSHDPPPPVTVLPPRRSLHRKSRFQAGNNATTPSATAALQPQPQSPPQPIPPHSRRTFRTPDQTKHLLSSPDRTSNPSSVALDQPLSPPKNLLESSHRRLISKSTCSLDNKFRSNSNSTGWSKEDDASSPDLGLNGFLKEQKIKFDNLSKWQLDSKAKILLPAPSNSTSSMVAAICYAWLLENRERKNKGEGDRERYMVVPVMNVRRGTMWKYLQTAWLFHHVGLDATSLLFADELDLESLMMAGKLSIHVVGQDILRTNGEVGSQCTIITDNYCEDAYDLLQTPMLKKLLLAGILLDTQNLDASAAMTRDAEAVQLLSVGSSPNYRNALFDQLMQDERDSSFTEALKNNYGKAPNGQENGEQWEYKVPEKESNSISHNEVVKQTSNKNHYDGRNGKYNKIPPKSVEATVAPATQAVPDNSRGKNKFSLSKWFGFGSK